MTATEFFEKTGRLPVDDELDRVNCEKPGTMGHFQCGWCDVCNAPRFNGCHHSERAGQ